MSVETFESGSGNQEQVAFPSNFVVATDVSLALGLERMVVVFVPEGSLKELTRKLREKRKKREKKRKKEEEEERVVRFPTLRCCLPFPQVRLLSVVTCVYVCMPVPVVVTCV